MPLQWTTTSQHALRHGIKAAVHGLSGSGKTRLIATAPRPVIASAESGTLSIAGASIPMCGINNLADLCEFYSWCQTSAEARNFDTVALDSVTEIAERLLAAEKLVNKDPRKAYGEMMEQIFIQLRNFRDLPSKHVYFTVKSGLLEMPDGTHMMFPIMPGKKTAEQLPYYFDEFFYLGVAEFEQPATAGVPAKKVKYRYLQTQRTPLIEAKDRSGALDEIEQPDLANIFAKIMKHHAS